MDSKEYLEENKTSKETKLFEISIQNINYELELTKSEYNKYILFKLSPKNNNIKYYILKLNLIQFKYIHSFFSFYNDINEIYDLLSNSLNNKKYTISFKDNICIIIFKFEMPGNKIINIDFNLKEIYENSLTENIYKEINNLKEENKNIKDELNKKNNELIEIKNDNDTISTVKSRNNKNKEINNDNRNNNIYNNFNQSNQLINSNMTRRRNTATYNFNLSNTVNKNFERSSSLPDIFKANIIANMNNTSTNNISIWIFTLKIRYKRNTSTTSIKNHFISEKFFTCSI
jgi:hypothetical protein